MGRTILWDLADTAQRQPDAVALRFANASVSYGELWEEALSVCRLVQSWGGHAPAHGRNIVLLTDRSLLTFSGLLGIMLSGNVCVPMTPRGSGPRALQMLLQSEARTIVVDENCHELLEELLAGTPDSVDVLYAEEDEVPDHLRKYANARGYTIDPAGSGGDSWHGHLGSLDEEALAYLLFTSGSTGTPKGVPVSHRNLTAYCRAMMREITVRADDRVSQFFEPTFDLFMHDLFVTFAAGASLCIPSVQDLMAPASYIEQFGVSIWFSVPYLGKLVCQQLRGEWSAMRSLRAALFCGEALSRRVAEQWSRCLPQLQLWNLYGPTEATIAVSVWRYRAECSLATLPIGRPIGELEMVIVDDVRGDVTNEQALGEIWLGGEQVVRGYFHDAERTRHSFVERRFEGCRSARWYRTGDLGRFDPTDGFLFEGRADFQVKIRGYRVELGEVEAVVQRILGVHTAVVVPWPIDADGAALGLVAVASGDVGEERDFIAHCARALTGYMCPSRLFRVSSLPLGPNGKVDGRAIRAALAAEARDGAGPDHRRGEGPAYAPYGETLLLPIDG